MLNRWCVGFGQVALILAMAVLPGYADQGHGGMQHGGHDQQEQDDHSGHYLKHLLKHAKEIGLMQEQIVKLKALQLDFKRTEARLEADTKIAKLELQALLEDEKADLNAIHAKVDQLKKSEAECLFAAIKSTRDAMALLTPDQREKARAHREAMKKEHEGEQGGRMGGMGGGGMMGGMGGMGGGGMMGGGGHGGRGGGHGGSQTGGGQGGHGGGEQGSGGSSGGQQHQH